MTTGSARASAKSTADDFADLPAARITPYPDGPLVVRGDFVVCDLAGAEIPTGKSVALCRCGRSAQKPFCDGSHKAGSRARSRD